MLLLANLAALTMTFGAPTVQSPTGPCDWNPPAPVVPPDCHSIDVSIAIAAFNAAVEQAESDCRSCMIQAGVAHSACKQQAAGIPWYFPQPHCDFDYFTDRALCSLESGQAVIAAVIAVNAAIEAACN